MGESINIGDSLGYVERPSFLIGRSEAFAMYVINDSMEPAFKAGHMIYVDPSRPVTPGDDIVIEMLNGEAFIKSLVRRTDTEVVTAQHNPKGEVSFRRSEVKGIYLVVASVRTRI